MSRKPWLAGERSARVCSCSLSPIAQCSPPPILFRFVGFVLVRLLQPDHSEEKFNSLVNKYKRTLSSVADTAVKWYQ